MSTEQIRVAYDEFDRLSLADKVAELRKPFGVNYAYPTSDRARELGCTKTGCWFAVRQEHFREQAISGAFATEQEALQWLAESQTAPVA